MPLDETRATARLPHLDIEIAHRRAPEEGAELLRITLRAAPDFGAAAAMLDPFRLANPSRLVAAWAAFNPWLGWLSLMGAPAAAARPLRRPAAR
jgi:hypothetical protein